MQEQQYGWSKLIKIRKKINLDTEKLMGSVNKWNMELKYNFNVIAFNQNLIPCILNLTDSLINNFFVRLDHEH